MSARSRRVRTAGERGGSRRNESAAALFPTTIASALL